MEAYKCIQTLRVSLEPLRGCDHFTCHDDTYHPSTTPLESAGLHGSDVGPTAKRFK